LFGLHIWWNLNRLRGPLRKSRQLKSGSLASGRSVPRFMYPRSQGTWVEARDRPAGENQMKLDRMIGNISQVCRFGDLSDEITLPNNEGYYTNISPIIATTSMPALIEIGDWKAPLR
jgi:hypothetical protein